MANTPVDHQQVAQQILLSIRAIPQQIAGFIFLPPSERQRLAFLANVPVRFLTSAAAAVEVSSSLVAASGINAETIRDAVAFRNALLPVADELIMIGQGVKHTVTSVLSGAGNAAYRVYTTSKTLNRADDRELLIPHIENMRRALVRPRGSSEPVLEPEPPTQPQPDTSGGTKK